MMKDSFVVGVDFGTDSVRAIIVNAYNGNILGSASDNYKRWAEGRFCDPSKNQFRQHPLDHFESLENVIQDLLTITQIPASEIVALTIDTTGSSPVAVDRNGTPLAMLGTFENNPNAMVILWKDHTSIAEAERINDVARNHSETDFTTYSGGIYSSEWFWSKIFHVAEHDPAVDQAAWTWMEHCDLIAYTLTGSEQPENFKRSRCAAGHKGMWHASWGGYPHVEFFEKLHPSLARVRKTLPDITYTSDEVAGKLSRKWASRLGLSEDTIVSVGILDAHACAVGAGVTINTLVKVIGTSTCDMLVNRPEQIGDKVIPGISGQVDGSIIPGLIGFEAGQSAFGDVLAWFRDVLGYALKLIPGAENDIDLLQQLSEDAQKLPVTGTDVLALDWINGRRTPDANQALSGALSNLRIGTDAPSLFRALVESICFGARAINERFIQQGLAIDEIVGVGGVVEKSPFVMQTLSDVLQAPVKVSAADQSGALGCAMYASVAAGLHHSLDEALKVMGKGFKHLYEPNADLSDIYERRYHAYLRLGAFTEHELNH